MEAGGNVFVGTVLMNEGVGFFRPPVRASWSRVWVGLTEHVDGAPTPKFREVGAAPLKNITERFGEGSIYIDVNEGAYDP